MFENILKANLFSSVSPVRHFEGLRLFYTPSFFFFVDVDECVDVGFLFFLSAQREAARGRHANITANIISLN